MRALMKGFVVVAWMLGRSMVQGEPVAIGTAEPLTEGQAFPSPDKRHVATFTGSGFAIASVDGGEPAVVQSVPPVYRAKWTGDSKIFATVEHIAGGTDAAFFYVAAGHWVRSDTTPAGGPYASYRVDKWDVGEVDVKCSYKVTAAKGAPVARGLEAAPAEKEVAFSPAAISSLNKFVELGASSMMWTSDAAQTREMSPLVGPTKGGQPIQHNGTLAVDTDGCGPHHYDQDQQPHCSAMLDKDGKLVVRFLDNGKLNPAGVEDVNADVTSYGVAPKNLAHVNGGPLRVGDKIEVTTRNGVFTTILADFGPPGKYGEVSYRAVNDFKYQVIDNQRYGPLPSPDGVHTPDIPVTVKYQP